MGLSRNPNWDDDQQSVAVWTRVVIGAGLLFVVSWFYSCSEMRYSMRGEVTTARIIKIDESDARRGSVSVQYTFADKEGKVAKGWFKVFNSQDIPADGSSVNVIYDPKDPSDNIPVDKRRRWAVIVFSLMTLVMIGAAAKLWLETMREVREERRRGR